MATEALLSQLMHSAEFIASQKLVLKQTEADAVMESMVDALIHQINNMPGIDTPTATKLNTAIQQSAYKPEHTADRVFLTLEIKNGSGAKATKRQFIYNSTEYIY